MSEFNVWSYFAKLGVQVRVPNDPFFEEGDHLCKVNEPVYLTVEDVEEFLHIDYKEFPCQVPGCRAMFSQVYESEVHYNAVHKHSCSVCKKSLPSYHLLELHIQENHDSFFSIVSERKPSFQCFLPTCTSKFWNAEERRDHAISQHKFPPDFRFDNTKKKPRPKSAKVDGDNGGRRKPRRNGAFRADSDGRESSGDLLEEEDSEMNGNGTVVEQRKTVTARNSMEVDGEEVVLRRNTGARRPISLARMGERRSVHIESPVSPPALPPPSFLVKQPFHATSPDVSREMAAELVSPKIGQPLKNNFGLAKHSPHSYQRPEIGSPLSGFSPRRDLGDSPASSPRKSKIPVRSNSLRAPKNITFGAGVPKTFQRPKTRNWHQSTQEINTTTDIDTTDFSQLKESLPMT